MNMFIGDILEAYQENDWYELNKDDLPELADKYQVMGIPSLLIFKNGEKRVTFTVQMPKHLKK